MRKDPKIAIKELADKIGKAEVCKLLVMENVSTSTAEKLAAGRYKAEIKALMASAIERAFQAAKTRAS